MLGIEKRTWLIGLVGLVVLVAVGYLIWEKPWKEPAVADHNHIVEQPQPTTPPVQQRTPKAEVAKPKPAPATPAPSATSDELPPLTEKERRYIAKAIQTEGLVRSGEISTENADTAHRIVQRYNLPDASERVQKIVKDIRGLPPRGFNDLLSRLAPKYRGA